jgi:hypothetical protein
MALQNRSNWYVNKEFNTELSVMKKIVIKVLSVIVFGLSFQVPIDAAAQKASGLGSFDFKKMESRTMKPDDIET